MNNAGVMAQERVITVLLTQKLLKPLLESKQGRIINVVSSVYGMGKFDAAHLGSTEGKFSPIAAYATSKLLLTMWNWPSVCVTRASRSLPFTPESSGRK